LLLAKSQVLIAPGQTFDAPDGGVFVVLKEAPTKGRYECRAKNAKVSSSKKTLFDAFNIIRGLHSQADEAD
jgi:hypothetical protein